MVKALVTVEGGCDNSPRPIFRPRTQKYQCFRMGESSVGGKGTVNGAWPPQRDAQLPSLNQERRRTRRIHPVADMGIKETVT